MIKMNRALKYTAIGIATVATLTGLTYVAYLPVNATKRIILLPLRGAAGIDELAKEENTNLYGTIRAVSPPSGEDER